MKHYMMDGVCLSESGLHQIRNLTVHAVDKRPRQRRTRLRMDSKGISRLISVGSEKSEEDTDELKGV